MSNQLVDPRSLSLGNKLKWGLGAAAVIAAGALAWLYIVSLASLAIAGTLTLVVVHAAPWMSQKLANFFLDMRKADARSNPITNRERISGDMWSKLEERRREIENMSGEVNLWESQIRKLPDEEQHEFEADLTAAKAMVQKQALAWKDAETAAQAFDKVTAKVKRKWEVAQIGLRIKRLSQRDQDTHINTILANEAADAADRALAVAFTSLDAIVAQAQTQRPAIANDPSPVIDVPSRVVRPASSYVLGGQAELQNRN